MADEVVVKISGDTSGVTKEFDKVQKSATDMAKGVTDSVKETSSETNKSLEAVKKSLNTIAISSAASFASISLSIRGFLNSFIEADGVTKQLNVALKNTSGTLNVTEKEVNNLAKEIQSYSKFSDTAVKSSVTFLLRMNNMSDEVLPRAEKAIVNLASAMGTDLQTATMQVGKALQSPANGLLALSRAGIKFSEDQQTIIKSLVETGKVAEAQEIILGKLEKRFEGAAETAGEGTGSFAQLKNEMSSVSEEIGKQLFPLLVGSLTALKDFFKGIKENEAALKAFAEALVLGAKITGLIAIVSGSIVAWNKMSAAIETASLAVTGLGAASKTALSVTGIGLFIVLLPDIINLLNDFWVALKGGATDPIDIKDITQVNAALTVLQTELSKTQERITAMREAGYAEIDITPLLDKEKQLQQNIIDLKRDSAAEQDKIAYDAMIKKDEEYAAKLFAEQEHAAALKLIEEKKAADKLIKDEETRQAELAKRTTEFEEDMAILQMEKDAGLLTEEEYQLKKQEITDRFNELKKGTSQKLADAEIDIARKKKKQEEDLDKKKIEDQKATLDTIAGLASSSNKTLATIGKAFAIYQSTIDTYAGISKALGAFPPPYNFAAAALVGAAGFANVARIAGMGGFAQGGMVTGGIPNIDSVPIMAQAGELIAPRRNFDEVVNAVADRRNGQANGDTSNSMSVVIQGNVYADSDEQIDRLIERINTAVEFRNTKLFGVT